MIHWNNANDDPKHNMIHCLTKLLWQNTGFSRHHTICHTCQLQTRHRHTIVWVSGCGNNTISTTCHHKYSFEADALCTGKYLRFYPNPKIYHTKEIGRGVNGITTQYTPDLWSAKYFIFNFKQKVATKSTLVPSQHLTVEWDWDFVYSTGTRTGTVRSVLELKWRSVFRGSSVRAYTCIKK